MIQMGWTSRNRYGIRYSTSSECYHRFVITETTDGYAVCDTLMKNVERTTTLAAAQAWAGMRMEEKCVRHASGHTMPKED